MPRPAVAAAPLSILIASGASGGHLFPAIAVAQALGQGAHPMAVTLVLGGRKFSDIVSQTGLPFVRLPAAGFTDRGPLGLAWAALNLVRGMLKAFMLVRQTRPAVVFGTGGYASVAVVVAAKVLGVRTVIHEQNVLPGRANRFLARLADVVVLTFPESRRYFAQARGQIVVAGTPLRASLLQAAQVEKPKAQGASFTVLVLGGSQGARILSEVVPETIALMPASERATLRVIHQARAEDVAQVTRQYEALGLQEVVVKSFFDDMPLCYSQADVLVGRSGVGTMLEAALFGVPAIYVPLELADGHQKLNAGVAEAVGAAVVVEQAYFTPANLLVHVRGLRADTARREVMAAAARSLSRPQATQAVAHVLRRQAGCPSGAKLADISVENDSISL